MTEREFDTFLDVFEKGCTAHYPKATPDEQTALSAILTRIHRMQLKSRLKKQGMSEKAIGNVLNHYR